MRDASKIKRFCRACGSKTTVTAVLRRYDDRNGKPIYDYYSTCPNADLSSWWKRFTNIHEAHVEIYENGETVPDYDCC